MIEAHIDERIHYAVYSASAYVTAEARCGCVEAVAAPAESDGVIGFYSILVTRADTPITSLAEAEGARLALVEGSSIAGRLVPLSAFRASGIDPEEHFPAIVDVGSPEAAIAALLSGEVDVAVSWSSLAGEASSGFSRGVLTGMVAGGAVSMDQLRIIWRSDLIPYGPHAIRNDLPPTIEDAIRRAVLDMTTARPEAVDAIDRSGIIGFVAPEPASYEVLRRLVRMPLEESEPSAPPPQAPSPQPAPPDRESPVAPPAAAPPAEPPAAEAPAAGGPAP
jgi:phosphonate transport system substrate-binding protein